ncbi:hypothetical protein BDN71DRAFT_988268 [Pleurotus eryngii]|uniref:Uncharacterized protein n=1 Tax=Pleurotus eryngii TaxID=5323 RepID=A0A9P5ZVF1_PLEER|nr:hypothetical protein BDN71DRAFT_988268 [Pleurotus eryngii]
MTACRRIKNATGCSRPSGAIPFLFIAPFKLFVGLPRRYAVSSEWSTLRITLSTPAFLIFATTSRQANYDAIAAKRRLSRRLLSDIHQSTIGLSRIAPLHARRLWLSWLLLLELLLDIIITKVLRCL